MMWWPRNTGTTTAGAAALRLVNRDRVGEAQRPQLVHADRDAPAVVTGEDDASLRRVVMGDHTQLAVHQLALVVVAGLDHPVADADAVPGIAAPSGLRRARSSAFSASTP